MFVQKIHAFNVDEIDGRTTLIFDRIKEELRNFCANHTIDEV